MGDQLLALMRRGEESMNVPLSKVPAYLADGWEEISRPPVVNPPAQKGEAAEKAAAGEVAETPKQRKAREAAEKAAAGEQTPPEGEPKG